jgi:hypothetical protein
MPHKALLLRRLNRSLDGIDPDATQWARDALRAHTDLGDAAEAAGLLHPAEDFHPDGVREALSSLPAAVGTALHATLLSAVERSLPVVVQWKEGAHVELQVWEDVDDGVGQVGVLLISPRFRAMAEGA